jgi:branched-chain amino acid transport system permease protein
LYREIVDRKIIAAIFGLGLLAAPFMGLRGAGWLVVGLAVGRFLVRTLAVVALRFGWVETVGRGTTLACRGLSVFETTSGKIACLFFLFSLPFFLNNYYLDTLSLAALYAILAVGLNITVGLAGLLDLGYAAFYGIGAYVYGVASVQAGIPFWIGLPLGGLAAAAFGMLLGIVTLRLRGDYLAIVTLGFVQIVYLILNNWESVTGGPNGILRIARPELLGFIFKKPAHFYFLILLLLMVTVIVVRRLTHSQIGRAWMAIRADETAAAAMGIHTARMKTIAFALGAGIAGMAGVIFAAKYSFISPESFNFQESVRILSMVVLGGMGSLPGVILGAVLLTLLPEMLRGLDAYRMLIFGATLVLMMVFRPQGLLGRKT